MINTNKRTIATQVSIEQARQIEEKAKVENLTVCRYVRKVLTGSDESPTRRKKIEVIDTPEQQNI